MDDSVRDVEGVKHRTALVNLSRVVGAWDYLQRNNHFYPDDDDADIVCTTCTQSSPRALCTDESVAYGGVTVRRRRAGTVRLDLLPIGDGSKRLVLRLPHDTQPLSPFGRGVEGSPWVT